MGTTTRIAAVTVGVSSLVCGLFTTTAVAQAVTPLPQPAGAGAPDKTPWTRQIAVEGQLGAAAPLGALGLAVDADVLPWLSISAGVGTDMFDPKDKYPCQCSGGLRQVALMPRLRLPLFDGATFLSLGAGLSRDAHAQLGGVDVRLVRQDDELGLEHRFDDGIRLRTFVGVGFSLNDPRPSAFPGSVYVGAAMGYAVVPNPERSSFSVGSWYGWQPLLSDVAASVVALDASGSQTAIRAGLAIYGLPPPMIHFAHHHYGRTLASVTLRTLLPYLLWANFATPNENGQTNEAAPIVAGAVFAAVIDDLLLSWN